MVITLASITAAALSVVKVIGAIGLVAEGLKVIGNIIMSIGKALGIIKPEMNVEQLGDKALQAEENGIKPENFESYEAYVNAVQDFKTDPEKSASYSPEDKIKKGIELSAGVAIEKKPDIDMEGILKLAGNKTFIENTGRFAELCKMTVSDPKSASVINGFINGTEKSKAGVESAIASLTKIEKELTPGISDSEALSNILKFQK